jgi:hypothetical protein
MTAPVRPTSVKAYTRDKWVFVPTIASQSAPTAVECTAAGTLDVSLMLFADSAKPAQNTNRPTKPKRWGDGVLYEQIGDVTFTGGTALFAFDPQGAAASTGVKAWEKFVAGTTGFWVRRVGIAIATDLTAGQFVDVYPTEYGTPMPTTEGDGETAEAAFQTEFAITGPPTFKVALV